MSANDCLNCAKQSEVIADQKKKMALIEVRLKDLVMAYKKVCSERDNLLAIGSAAVLPLNDLHEQQKRLSSLEASVSDMAAICGKYESQSVKDKQLIHELTQKCEQLSTDLSKSHETNDTNVSHKRSTICEKTFRQRGIQTDEWLEATDERADPVMDKEVKHTETQTDVVSEFDVFNGSNRKRTELAVVLPTLSETQPKECESDLDQLSDRETSPVHSVASNGLDNYPVFETNGREMCVQSSGDLFSGANTSGVSLFYANELARKEIDLAETRIQAREHECALRELLWKYNTEKYKSQTRINDLERNLSQMSSNQPLSQLNVTYIRNVLMKLLNTKDKQQKQFMINAILTALEQKDRKPK
ncbi:unnamed protein product [Medioppia subpectinata]|uniref:GRIP domain-containing protein n=1 Tax=Medioppia subpectinata TaxID=1979941 RepID=A0A7R9PVB8_9ACAR|nr:unnamed protein product [Medioppia subpectinata]CAG2102459.1 unnamed protein product [Medioppia subpectinata]